MTSLSRVAPFGLLFAVVLWGCDATAPAPSTSSISSGEDYQEEFEIAGSVFINDEDENVDVREPNELGIAQVRVDLLYTPNGECDDEECEGFVSSDSISVLTDDEGRYSALVPYSGLWTVRVTPEPSAKAFNPTLFASYDPASVTERLVEVGDDYEVGLTEDDGPLTDFSFEPDLGQVLQDLTEGPLVTDARPLRVWRRWMRHALAERNDCPNQTNWLCRSDIEAALEAIFDAPGDDPFFGNSEPFALEAGDDPFAVANDILKARPRTEEGELIQELLLAELNYFSGFGTPDPNYDRTLLRYVEVFVGASSGDEARLGVATALEAGASARVRISEQLAVLSAYNRGGGGGGQVGD